MTARVVSYHEYLPRCLPCNWWGGTEAEVMANEPADKSWARAKAQEHNQSKEHKATMRRLRASSFPSPQTE